MSINKKRGIFLICFIGLVFFIFIVTLINWQIMNSDYYKKRSIENNSYLIKTDAVRGEILDRNGVGLAVNLNSYRLVLDRLNIKRELENDYIIYIVKLLENLNCEWINILPIELENQKFKFSENSESQISILRKNLKFDKDKDAQDCVQELKKRYKLKDSYNIEDSLKILSVRYNMEKSVASMSRIYPYLFSNNLDKNTVLVLSEKFTDLKNEINLGECLRIETYLKRKYLNSEVVPHLLGYIARMSNEEYEKNKIKNYSMDSLIGKSGIENAFEDSLRGKDGQKLVEISRKSGVARNIFEKEKSIPGNTIYLTIDSELQKVVNNSLKENITKARETLGIKDCRSGAAVVLDIKDFSVLAAGTFPTYDLSRFVEDPSYYPELLADKKNVPLLNRAFNGAFAPGSIYKPLIAIAALENNLITSDETIYCKGYYDFYRNYKLRCMGTHGRSNLKRALSKSCNVYFSELGRRLGPDLIKKFANKFGMGIKTGIEISESIGIIAGPEHSQKVGVHWYESGSSQAAIGQSDNMITPLQLAVYTATIANNGVRKKTHLLKKSMDYAKNNVLQEINEFNSEISENLELFPENLSLVQECMREVVLSGTARDFVKYPIEIAAKTGTAQNSGSDHTTFICYAPLKNPEIAIAVVIANGKNGKISKNVAKDIMNKYFNLPEKTK
ncbi:MAG: penicillin-binding protein [Candidatus Paraimprobicoccus trichonymphae]|uniref:Penicillin-binding protein n=1 Tax=Candidatus Paraimprobicoccus trichonymphae TaxID=3033793 RepID=A0AA48IA58_9FIRM|nr:MAG: penicillin-binding protein [Candidatus Paraimprobicoccus trichonymphae]